MSQNNFQNYVCQEQIERLTLDKMEKLAQQIGE